LRHMHCHFAPGFQVFTLDTPFAFPFVIVLYLEAAIKRMFTLVI
jgi:hypothetical protein